LTEGVNGMIKVTRCNAIQWSVVRRRSGWTQLGRPRRLRELLSDHIDDLAETAIPRFHVAAWGDLRQRVSECLRHSLYTEQATSTQPSILRDS